MSDAKYYAKAKLAELQAELEQAWKKPGKKPAAKVDVVLKKILANTAMNNSDMILMMPAVIRIMSLTGNDHVDILKLCCNYLTSYSDLDSRNVINDALPILTKWLSSSLPQLRILAIRTLLQVNRRPFIDAALHATIAKLNDSDPQVRKVLCYAVARLYQHAADQTDVLIHKLNDMLLEESDTVVLALCLAALSSITDVLPKFAFALTKQHCQVLISRLEQANEWGKLYIINALMGYVPQLGDEAIDLIEAVMPWLSHENTAVVLNAIKIIVYLNNYASEQLVLLALPTLPKRIGLLLVALLTKPLELEFLVLRNAILLLLGRRYLINVDVLMFFCNYDDPIYVKDTKLEIIYLLADSTNVARVLRELEEYATEVDVQMARKAIRAFGNLAVKVPEAATDCVNVVVELLSHGVPYIVQEAAVVIKNIVRKYPHQFNSALVELIKHYDVIDEPDAKASLLWMLGQFGESINGSNRILALMVTDFDNDAFEVQNATITAAVKLYLKQPESGEATMLQVLKAATEQVNNPDIRDRGFMYWNLITAPQPPGAEWQAITKKVVLNPQPGILGENDTIDPAILEELELNIGTLLLIYLKPVRAVFRLSKQKRLMPSPALQPRPINKRLSLNRNSQQLAPEIPQPRPSKFGVHLNLGLALAASLPIRSSYADLIGSSFDGGDSSPTKRPGMMKRISRRIPSVVGGSKNDARKL